MSTNKLVFERTYNAPIAKVWKAITDKDQMKEWYFDVSAFEATPGFEFSFTGGSEEKKYTHKCKVLEANPVTKLSYTWTYEGYPGYSVVSFDLEPVSKTTTRLILTHTGVDSFPQDLPDFAASSFTQGWQHITGISLANFVETDSLHHTINISSTVSSAWNVIINPNNQWANAFGSGSLTASDWKQGSEITWTDLQGNIGARGIITNIEKDRKLEMTYYDSTVPVAGEQLGEYTETLELLQQQDGTVSLNLFSGPTPKKYLESHGNMWKKAAEMIKNIAEENPQ